MPDPTLASTWESGDIKLPMLYKSDGSAFSATVYVRSYLPPYTRDAGDSVTLANNVSVSFPLGNPQVYIDSFTVEVWGAAAYVEVMEATNDRTTNGVLTLKVPEFGGSTVTHKVKFAMPPMSRAYPRREGFVQVFTVDVENIRVFD